MFGEAPSLLVEDGIPSSQEQASLDDLHPGASEPGTGQKPSLGVPLRPISALAIKEELLPITQIRAEVSVCKLVGVENERSQEPGTDCQTKSQQPPENCVADWMKTGRLLRTHSILSILQAAQVTPETERTNSDLLPSHQKRENWTANPPPKITSSTASNSCAPSYKANTA